MSLTHLFNAKLQKLPTLFDFLRQIASKTIKIQILIGERIKYSGCNKWRKRSLFFIRKKKSIETKQLNTNLVSAKKKSKIR